MSDMLNEKFGEFVTQNNLMESMPTMTAEPAPTVKADVIPGSGSDPTAVSGDPQQRNKMSGDPAPTVSADKAYGITTAPTDLGGSSSEPLHSNKESGEDNPGAKASAPVSQISGDPQQRHGNHHPDPAPTVGAEVAYGITKMGAPVTYPIKPSFEGFDISDDVNALTEGLELTEEYKEKIATIFEAAVKAKISEEYDRLVEHFATELNKQVESVKAEISEEVDGTVNYAINRWLEENQVAIDRGIKNELNEELIAGFLNVLSANHVNIPDDKIDVVEGMAETIREMEDRLNEQVKSNIEISKQLSEVKSVVILNQVSEGLADTQKEKLAALAEGVDFKSTEDYTKKLTTIRESYFKTEAVKSAVDENPVEISEEMSPAMAAYAKALRNWNS
jgi:hypothetical protein